MSKSITYKVVFAIFLANFLKTNDNQGCSPRHWIRDDFYKEPKSVPDHDPAHIQSRMDTKLKEAPYHVSIKKRVIVESAIRYHTFCEGSIIREYKVLTAAHCFLTNKKRLKLSLEFVRATAGGYSDIEPMKENEHSGQWRHITQIDSPRYYRYPVNDIALMHIDRKWNFNERVNWIPYASVLSDYDGPCVTAGYGFSKEENTPAQMHVVKLETVSRSQCENLFMKNMRGFVCTTVLYHDPMKRDSGSGLVCRGTGDPQEADRGVLAGVQVKVNRHFPSLHTRVSAYHRWITDEAPAPRGTCLFWTCLLVYFVLN